MIHKLSWVARLFKRSSAQVASKQSEKNTRFIFEEMEPRKLFSADPLAGLLEIDDFELPQVETLIVDHVSESYNNNSISSISDDIPSTDIEIRHELVFVDSGVENYEQLIDDLNSQGNGSRIFSVFILESGKNGIEQITEELQNYEDIDALHIISHGTPGVVLLGNTQLNSTNINDYTAQISLWQNAFDQDADILIYGCELVGNEAGENLTAQLSELTGADVAASVDDTGSATKGGDWELEFSTGVIETKIAISEQTQQSWDGLLAYHTYRDEFDTISFGNSDGSIDWTGNPWIELGETNGANTGRLAVSTELVEEQGLSISNSNNGAQREVDLSGATNATISFEYARIGLDDATDFITLSISKDGGTTWDALDSWQGSANDTSLNYANYDISNYITSNTQIKFISSGLTEGGDKFFVDNFQVAYSNDLDTKSEFLVNQNTAGVQITSGATRGSHQSVAVASNGDYVVVWTEAEGTGDLSDVFAQQYSADGEIKTPVFQVNTTSTTGEQQWASVASDASGRFVITWTGDSQDGKEQQVYLKRFNANGFAIDTDDILVNSLNITGNQHSASVALNSQGDMVITWQSDEAGNEGVYARLFDMTSATTGNEVQTSLITVASGTSQLNPSVDINSEGKFVIAWKLNTDVYAQLFDENSDKRGSQFKINTFNSQFPVVAIQDSGNVLVAYRVGMFAEGIWVRQFGEDGIEIGTPTKVSSNSSDTAPSIAKGLDGNFIVVYEGTGDGGGKGVFVQKYDFNKNAIGSQFQINETIIGNQQAASVAMLDLNNYVVVWSGNGSGDSDGVFARQFNTAAPNSLPTADASAGAPYVINEGDSITLNGSNSSDPDADTLTFSWDLNNDFVYGDVIGENPLVSWTTLQGKEINDEGNYTIGLQVNDGHGGIDTITTTLTVNNTAPILSTTGASIVAQRGVYTLNLSAVDPGADTITSWTINWGDGAIETYVGNPSSVTHTYTNGGFTNNILASAIDEDGTYLQNDLLVADYTGAGGIFHFSETGEFLGPVIGTSDLDKSIAVIVGPDGNWYGSGEASGNVYRYNTDGGTSKVIMGGFGQADGLAFDSDGNLYVASWAQNKVYKLTHNTSDDSYTKTEIVSDATFNRPYGLIFGPNGDLYVSSYADHNVQRLALNTDGSYTASVFISDGLGGLNSPEQMAFGPDGKLYLTSAGSKEVLRYNPENVSGPDPVMELIATLPSGGRPEGLAFGPDGNLYISDHDFGDIIRFNMIVNGEGDLEVLGGAETFIDGADSTLTKPVFMTFIPEHQVMVVNTNQMPVINDQIFSLAENSLDGFTVGTVTATDPDLDNLSYTITTGNDLGAFAISNTGVITVADSSQLDFETNPAFNLTVQVMDDGVGTLSNTATVSINLSQVNEAPVITNQSFSLLENSLDGVTVGTVTATDPDAGDNLSYTITAGNDLNAFVMSSTGVITVADSSQLDFETNPAFNLTVQVMDDGTGTLSSTATVSINLNPVNEVPVINNQTFALLENSSNGSVVGGVIASDPDAGDSLSYSIMAGNSSNTFVINSTSGEITVADSNQLDYETTPAFNLTVQVTDGVLNSTATISINLNPVNEVPVINDQTFALLENSSNGSVVGSVIASDPDAGDSLSYSITTGNSSNAFTINSTTGEITVADSNQLDYETTPSFDLTVQGTDGVLNSTATISINLNPVNEVPVINDQTFSLLENSPGGSVVGSVIATDPDIGDSLNYSITTGNSSGAFAINSTTGEITVADSSQLDYETTPAFSLTIQVMDDGVGNLSNTATINIEINKLPDSISLSNNTIDEHLNTSTGYSIGRLIFSDKDSDNFQIVGGVDQVKFSIGGDDNNELILTDGTLDFENQSSYQVTVRAIESDGGSHDETFIISVNNLNEKPLITSGNSITLEENITRVTTVIAEDENQPIQKLSYSISGGADSKLFLLDKNTGELSFKTAPDFENPGDLNAENIYWVEITVDDGNGGTVTQPVSIQIKNAAEAPNLSDQSVILDEKSDIGTLVTTLVANDPDVDETFSFSILEGELSDAFTIDNTGQLIVSRPELLINQDSAIVSVVIQVTDSEGLTDTSVVQIDIRSILLDSSVETEVEIKPEAEIEKQEEFTFSVLTELPFEEGTNLTKNDIAIKPELNESVSEEQTKTEVNENTVNIILDTKQGSEVNDSFGVDVKTKQEKSSFSTQKYNFNKQEHNWTSKNILIKAKVATGNTQIIPQFSYFEIAAKELQYLVEESGFSESLDVLREQIQENTYFEKTVVGSSITVTTGLSIGYVIWLVRGGVLLSSVLSSLPAWRMIDPLPVISSLNGSLDNDDENSDSLASLIKKGSEVVKAKVKIQTPTPPVD